MKILTNVIRVLFLILFIFLLSTGKMTLWLGLYAASLLLAVFFGRIYCGYVCPMNTLMLPTAWLSKKLKIQSAKNPKWLEWRFLPWLGLLLSLAAMLLAKRVLQVNLPVLPFWLALSVLVTLRYKPEVFHNLLCPFGPLQKFFGRFARMSRQVAPDACIGCHKCEKACPAKAIAVVSDTRKAVISQSMCLQCAECQNVCPTAAIKYQSCGVYQPVSAD